MPRRNVLRSQARQMVHDVLKFMKNEAQEGIQLDLKSVQRRTAAATGVSERTVRRIVVLANLPGATMHEVFRTPGKKRTGRRNVTAIGSINLGLIKRFVHNFHKTENELPTVKLLLKRLQELFNFKGQSSSMRRVLSGLGFKWMKTGDGRKILIEHASIRQKRIEYLQGIQKYRAEERPIAFVDSSSVVNAPANQNTVKGPNKSERVVIVNAATDQGFLPNTLLSFKSSTKGDDNKQYDKWLRTQLIPNLPANAVVVVGKTPFFNRSEEAAPSSTSKRCVMESWLLDKGIPFTTTMLKPQLYKLVCTYKCGYRQYKIDGILNENNHPVLRFPPCHPDLNPWETAWPPIKGHVSRKAAKVDVMKKLIKNKTSDMEEEMITLCKNIKNIEDEYALSDMVIDALTDEVTIHVSDDESDETDEDSGSEEEQNDGSSSEDDVSNDVEFLDESVSF